MARVLVVAPHPDDETLGCGGALLKHMAAGDEVFWLVCTRMTASRGYSAAQMAAREALLARVHHAYGFAGMKVLDFAAGGLDAVDFGALIRAVGGYIKEVAPSVIYAPNRSDVHTDHQVTARAVWSCTKAFRQPGIAALLMYETVSETDYAPAFLENAFVPNVFVDISGFLEQKLALLALYETELLPAPFPRSPENVRAMGVVRGGSVNVRAAEAFMLVRAVWQEK